MMENVLKFIRNPSSFDGVSKTELEYAQRVFDYIQEITFQKFLGKDFLDIDYVEGYTMDDIEILKSLGYSIEENSETIGNEEVIYSWTIRF